MIRALFILLLSVTGALAQGGSYCTMSTWEPRNLVTKAGIVASYDPGNTGANVSNPAGWAAGSGVSALSNRVTTGTADLLQGTAANQPLVSRADNKGNLCLQSEAFQTTWSLTKCNAFGATDTGASGAGSFANTTRTLDPLGGNNADFVQEDASLGLAHHTDMFLAALPAGVPLTVSCWAAPAGRSWISLRCYGNTASFQRNFNVTTGAEGATAIDAGITGFSSSITAAANGFYRVSITGTRSTQESAIIIIYIKDADNFLGYNGDNTSGLFLWGASLRPSTWDPAYIPTTTVPIYAGLGGRQVLYHDGSAYYLKTAAFTLNQPTEVYSLGMPLSWTLNDAMFDGNALNSGKLYQSATTPNIRYTAGTVGTEFVPPPQGTWRVSTVVFDGANSRISTNTGPFTVSDAGAGNMGGFTLGAAGTVGTTFWNGLRGREILCNKTNQTAEASYIRWGMLKQASLY